MHIAFFNAYDPRREYQESLPSLGIGYLMAYLKRHAPSIEVSFHHTEADLLACGANVAAISSASENFGAAQRLARAVREALGAFVLLGGVHITALPHTLPREFNAAVLGEGEETLLELAWLLEADRRPSPTDLGRIAGICFRDGDAVTITAPRPALADLDLLPWPDREGLGDRFKVPFARSVHLIASRGCPYKCTFCASGRLWKGYRVFSAAYVAGELAHVRARWNPREIHFFDDLFIGHRGRFRQFCRLLEERGLHQGVAFRSWGRADLVDEEMADALARYNFRAIDLGLESACHRTLEYLGKLGASPEVNQRALELLSARGISVGVSMIIGAPRETREEMNETYDFLEANRARIDRLGVGLLMPLPGTPVWDEAARRGVVSEEMEWERLGIDFESADIRRCPIVSETMDPGELAEMFRRFNALERVINARGEVRRLAEENARLAVELDALRIELASLRGSRAVQLAMKVRDTIGRWRRGGKGAPSASRP